MRRQSIFARCHRRGDLRQHRPGSPMDVSAFSAIRANWTNQTVLPIRSRAEVEAGFRLPRGSAGPDGPWSGAICLNGHSCFGQSCQGVRIGRANGRLGLERPGLSIRRGAGIQLLLSLGWSPESGLARSGRQAEYSGASGWCDSHGTGCIWRVRAAPQASGVEQLEPPISQRRVEQRALPACRKGQTPCAVLR